MSDEARPSFTKRHPWLTGCGGAIALIFLIGTGLVFSVRGRIDRRWAEFEASQDAIIGKLRAQDGRRTPLLGPVSPGNAWDGYGPAFTALAEDRGHLSDAERKALATQMVDAPKPEGRDLAGALVAARQPLLEPLRKAVRRERALFPVNWSLGYDSPSAPTMKADWATQLLVLSARNRRLAGDLDGCIDDVAVALQLSLDLARPISLIGSILLNAGVRFGTSELKEVLLDAKCAPGQVERIASMVNAVNAQIPGFADVLEADFVIRKQSLRRIGNGQPHEDQSFEIELSDLAKHGFSRRAAFGEAAMHADLLLDAARRGMPLPWIEAKALFDSLRADPSMQGNPVSCKWVLGMAGSGESFRRCSARLRVLQAAILLRQGRDASAPEWPPDPFTLKPLLCRVDGSKARIWSLWVDGVDNAKGGWQPKDNEDLVLELQK